MSGSISIRNLVSESNERFGNTVDPISPAH